MKYAFSSCFMWHSSHLIDEADQIARRFGARHVNYTGRDGYRQGWFETHSPDEPFTGAVSAAVQAAIEQAGGLAALTKR